MRTRVHVSLEVSNLEASLAFYSRLFQSAPTKTRPAYANFRLDEPALHLSLIETPRRPPEPLEGPGSNRHFGIELFEDARLEEWRTSAQAAGLSLKVENDITCCFAKANKFWARDPDGHNWEFWVRQAEADTMHDEEPARIAGLAPSCCAPTSAKAQTLTDAPRSTCCG